MYMYQELNLHWHVVNAHVQTPLHADNHVNNHKEGGVTIATSHNY